MMQRVYRQIRTVLPHASIIVATSIKQVSTIQEQLGKSISLSIEPRSRNTFPALALAVLNLVEHHGATSSDYIVACPIDSYVDDTYFLSIKDLVLATQERKANIGLLGITPSSANVAYGYILPGESASISRCKKFYEKPDPDAAKRYIEQGALWNSGVFVCQISYIQKKINDYGAYNTVRDIIDNYNEIPDSSIDYLITENEANIIVKRYQGTWTDIGGWETFSSVLPHPIIGKVVADDATANACIINRLTIPIICMGMKNVVVVANTNGILVADKSRTQNLKMLADSLQIEDNDY